MNESLWFLLKTFREADNRDNPNHEAVTRLLSWAVLVWSCLDLPLPGSIPPRLPPLPPHQSANGRRAEPQPKERGRRAAAHFCELVTVKQVSSVTGGGRVRPQSPAFLLRSWSPASISVAHICQHVGPGGRPAPVLAGWVQSRDFINSTWFFFFCCCLIRLIF